MDLVKVMPDKEKAQSIHTMVEKTLEMIAEIDRQRFPSNVIKEYYEVIRELISIVLLLDGFKAIGEGAHKRQIEYLEAEYPEFRKAEIMLIDELRIIRNKVAYDGFFVKENYIDRNLGNIQKTIEKLRKVIRLKLG